MTHKGIHRTRQSSTRWTVAVLGLALLGMGVVGLVSPSGGGASATHHPSAHYGLRALGTSTGTSTNWAGYAVTTPNGAVTDVKGNWVVPTFKGSCGGFYNESESAFWVGIDGDGSKTVEQIGTSIQCSSIVYVSSISYFAWYEFYPAGSVTIGLTISHGDHISAEVKYTPSFGSYTLSIKDTTTGKSFSTSSSTITANRSSAEWIAEAPSNLLGTLPLVNFGSVHFTGCSATISGHTHAISGFSNIRWTMVNTAGAAKAAPGSLTSGGSAFTVTWKSYGP